MSYSTQFTFEFDAMPPTGLGISPHSYRVSFLRRDYTGDVVGILMPYDNPYKLKTDGSSDSVNPTLMPQQAIFEMVCQNRWDAQSFYVQDDREMQVLVEVNYNDIFENYQPHWHGWVLAADIKEPYGPKPYIISVSASDGLSTLKDYPFLDSTGSRPKGFLSIAEVIRICLSNSAPVSVLVTGFNLFDLQDVGTAQASGGLANPATDPLYNTLVQAELFAGTNGTNRTCWDVLDEVLRANELRLSQVGGEWWAMRWPEMGGGYDKWGTATTDTIHIRVYTSTTLSDAAPTHSSMSLKAYTNPAGPFAVKEGSLWVMPVQNGISVKQTYGAYKNTLVNGDFSQVDNTGLPTGFRRKNISDPNKAKRYGTGTDADPYRLRIYGSDYEGFIDAETQGVDIQFNWPDGDPNYVLTIERNKKLTRTLKGRFRLFNARGAKIVIRCSALRYGSPWWILADGGMWVHNPNAGERKGIIILHDVLSNNIDTPKPGWCSFSIDLPPVVFNPEYGAGINALNFMLCKPYTLETYNSSGHVLGPVTTPEPYIEFANIELVNEDKSIVIDGTQRTIVKPGKVAKTTLDITMGDVPNNAKPYDRLGSTFQRHVSGTPITSRERYLADQAIGPNGENAELGKPMIDFIATDLAYQLMTPCAVWEGTIYGVLPYGAQTVICVGDVGKTVNGAFVPDNHIIAGLTSDLRTCEHSITAPQLVLHTGTLPTVLREWVTPDGNITIENDPTTGLPVAPTLHGSTSAFDQIKQQLKALGVPTVKPILSPVFPGLVPLVPVTHPRPLLLLLATPTSPTVSLPARFSSIIALSRFL